MNHTLYTRCTLALLMSNCAFAATNTTNVTPFFSPRSQNQLPRQVVGVRDIEHRLSCSDSCWPGYLGATLAFSKTFNSASITHSLFGNALINGGCCQTLRVSGSRVAERNGNTELLADYFGLPTDFQSSLNFNPRIVNSVGDIQLYLRLDNWLCGLWFYAHAPINHTKWNLNLCEDIINPGVANYPEGYFSADTVLRQDLLASASEFFAGATPNIDNQTFNRLNNARITSGACSTRTQTRVADLQFWLGYDWLHCDKYNLGFGLIVVAPTGNRPEGRYLFEPIVGNGHHWELGGLIRGQYLFWQNCDQTHTIRGFTQANITHLFNARQRRTFDLKNKPLSRYALAEKIGGPSTTIPFLGYAPAAATVLCPNPVANFMFSDNQFVNEYTSVANLTTLCVDVSVNYQVDWVAMVTWSHDNFTWDLGYNLWARGCENISTKCCTNGLIAKNTWALKGDAYVYGFITCPLQPRPAKRTIYQITALAATESNATAFSGTNNGSTTNAGIDNPQYAYSTDGNPSPTRYSPLTYFFGGNAPQDQTNTSASSVFLSDSDINICGAQTKAVSNTVFTHIGYQWECSCWQPYIGIGGQAEVASGHRVHCNDTSCNTGSCSSSSSCPTTSSSCSSSSSNCTNVAASQWSVWIKGGFVFG